MKRRSFIISGAITAGAFTITPLFTSANLTTNMPKVVLLGDSIRKGYQPYVEKLLTGKAEVWAPQENCQTSDNIIYHLFGWIKIQKPDVIHINAGLHDIRTLTRESGPGETIVKPAHYKDNLRTIFSWIQQNMGCKVIWATTTPVVDERLKTRKGSFTRFDSDVQKINKIALKVARKYGVEVNDLYTYVKNEIGEEGMKKDGVHFLPGANEKLGAQVANKILEVIQS